MQKRLPRRSRHRILFASILFALLAVLFFCGIAQAWHDETHLAVAKVAGYYKWYNAVGPDIAKLKAGQVESYNHFYDNPGNVAVTPETVLRQVKRYNDPNDKEGHLYGAIIDSIREYQKATEKNKIVILFISVLSPISDDATALCICTCINGL